MFETAAGFLGSVDGLLRSSRAGHHEKTAEDLMMSFHGSCSYPGWANRTHKKVTKLPGNPRSQQH